MLLDLSLIGSLHLLPTTRTTVEGYCLQLPCEDFYLVGGAKENLHGRKETKPASLPA
jgi:hypothetical protein